MPTGWRIFNGIQFHPAGWRRLKRDIQKMAKEYRERGYLARIVPETNAGKGSMKGYGLYVHGMQGRYR